jgi:hypothetical protein
MFNIGHLKNLKDIYENLKSNALTFYTKRIFIVHSSSWHHVDTYVVWPHQEEYQI